MASPEPTDEEMATRAGRGDRVAFRELLERYTIRLVRYLQLSCRVSGDDAEDLAQDVWLRTWRNLPGWQPSQFRGWLFKIARNAATDHHEKQARRRTEPLDAATGLRMGGSPVSNAAEIRDEVLRLNGCLAKLPPEFRVVFEGFVGGKTYEELAAELAVAMGTVKSRLKRARDDLQKCMRDEDE